MEIEEQCGYNIMTKLTVTLRCLGNQNTKHSYGNNSIGVARVLLTILYRGPRKL